MREMEFPIDKEEQARRWVCKHPDGPQEGCTRATPCRSDLGRRSRRKGLRKQNEVRKALEVPNPHLAYLSSQEEFWRGQFRIEAKAGAQVRPAWTAFLRAEKQLEANKAIGDLRPGMVVAMPDGTSDGLVMMRLSTWRAVVGPLLRESE